MKILVGKVIAIDNSVILIEHENRRYVAFVRNNTDIQLNDAVSFTIQRLSLSGEKIWVAENIKKESTNILKRE